MHCSSTNKVDSMGRNANKQIQDNLSSDTGRINLKFTGCKIGHLLIE